MIVDAQARAALEEVIRYTTKQMAGNPMPFERKLDEDGHTGVRALRPYHDADSGQTIYAMALIFVSETRETLVRILEANGGPLDDD